MANRDPAGVRVVRAPGRRILVAGGADFIGSQLCERLLGVRKDVVWLDNLPTDRMQNIAHLLGQARFKFVRHDVTEPFDIGRFDPIDNLACAVSQRDSIHTLRTYLIAASGALQ